MNTLLRLAGLLSLTALIAAAPLSSASGAVRVRDICTILGQEETQLTGLGIVTGLQGTGDNKFGPTYKALRTMLGSLNDRDPRKNAIDIKGLLGSKNVALVIVSATVPARGVKRGQKVDCMVTAVGTAKSLRGGQLLMTPLSDVRNEFTMAVATGAVRIHGEESKTKGSISFGVEIKQNFTSDVIYDIGDGGQRRQGFYLLLDPSRAGFQMASVVAESVNEDTKQEAASFGRRDIADFDLQQRLSRVRDAGTISVAIPPSYRDDPEAFIAIVLDVRIESATTEARVIVNKSTNTVVISGEVELSPVIVTHKGLKIEVTEDDAARIDAFVALVDDQPGQNGVAIASQDKKLAQLLGAMEQLKLPAADIIDVILSLEKSGRLHARVIVVE